MPRLSCVLHGTVIAFYWEAGACDEPPPTIYVDAVVDTFFILDIVLNFW